MSRHVDTVSHGGESVRQWREGCSAVRRIVSLDTRAGKRTGSNGYSSVSSRTWLQ